jgi:hypothetical protein
MQISEELSEVTGNEIPVDFKNFLKFLKFWKFSHE